MFAKAVIGSAKFLRMPASARLLYYDLGIDADDDGIVEAFSTIRRTGSNENDLFILSERGFVRVLNEDLVTVINDWKTNNKIRSDRYHESIHKSLLSTPTDYQMTTNGIPDDNQRYTEVSIGKSTLGEATLGESIQAAEPPTRTTKKKYRSFGVYEWVKLTQEQYDDLVIDLGQSELDRCIQYVDESAQATGNKNKWKDWNCVIRKCSREKWGFRNTGSKPDSLGMLREIYNEVS